MVTNVFVAVFRCCLIFDMNTFIASVTLVMKLLNFRSPERNHETSFCTISFINEANNPIMTARKALSLILNASSF